MSPVELVFWTSGLIILLEVFFILSRAYYRRDVITAGMFYLNMAIVFIGIGSLVSGQMSLVTTGRWMINISMPLVPLFWLLFSVFWGRDPHGDMLYQRSKGWLYLVGVVALGLIAINSSYQILSYTEGPWYKTSIQASGYVFLSFVFFLVTFLFGLFNIENCYRTALGSQKRKLQRGFYVSLVLTAMAFAMATLGILQSHLAVWALLGLAITAPGLLFILAVHLVRYSPEQHGVVVTRRATSASSIIIIGAIYFLVIGALSKAMQWFEYSSEFMVVVIAGLLSLLLAHIILLSGRLLFPVSVIGGKSKSEVTVEDLKEFIEEIALLKTVDEIIERVRLFLRSNFGISGGAFIERHENDVCSIRYFDLTSHRGTFDRMNALCEWLRRYGKPVLYEDLEERIATGSENSVKWIRDMLGFTPSLIVPVIGRQHMIGILILAKKQQDMEKLSQLIQTLEIVSSPLALAIQNCRVTEELLVAREIESFNIIASYVLHDLKNSVSMLDMMVVNAKKNIDDPRFRESMFRTIGDAVNRQRRIIARLSNPGKEDEQVISTVDINKLLQEVIEQTQVRTMERIRLAERFNNIPVIQGNVQLLKSVFENIIVNAIEAMPVKGQLDISTQVKTDTGSASAIHVHIRDTGKGMSREFIEYKLFRPFTTTKKKGLGVGMYQAYEAVKKMGGAIDVESKEGVGTTFTVMIPV